MVIYIPTHLGTIPCLTILDHAERERCVSGVHDREVRDVRDERDSARLGGWMYSTGHMKLRGLLICTHHLKILKRRKNSRCLTFSFFFVCSFFFFLFYSASHDCLSCGTVRK